MYNLPAAYVSRDIPTYFDDVLDDSTAWQADVYRLAARLAAQSNVRRLVDLGCGRGHKLLQYADDFEIIGFDCGSNIEYCQQNHVPGTWIDHDLNTIPLRHDLFEQSVVICADVIEHLPNPEMLLKTLQNAVQSAEFVLVSTPDRQRVYRGLSNLATHLGPPGNPFHVREWTNGELQGWFESEGLPVVWTGWTISNETRPDQVWTSLLVLSNKHDINALSTQYEPKPRIKKRSAKPRSSGGSASNLLRVWMTPTPNEAQHDTTNAIHQIVMRMDGLLPDYGFELVEHPDNADLRVAHAGQGSSDPVDVAHYHGLYNTADKHNSKGFHAINSHVIQNLRTAKQITAPSEWIADVIRRDMHIDPHVIGWGVDTGEWTPAENPALYVLWNKARVDAISDPAPMLELAARVPNMPFLTTFGQGGENVKTIGRQPYEVMKNYVRNASVYLATVTETFGIATVEAMAAGVPILGFRHGNTADLVEHGVTGFLAEPGDIDGLVEGLIYCMKYRDRLGANAREAAKQHTWRRVAERFADVYRLALEPHRGVKVSVVIPCHNYEQYVGEAIKSAVDQQTTFPYEIIVVLDRCTDHSLQVVRGFADDGVIPLIVDNGSLSATRNDGIRHATGEYIVLLDADDKIGSPHFLQTLSDALDKDRTLGIAFTSIRVMDADGNLGHLNAWPKGYDFDLQAQRKNQVPSCCMFRKEAWRRAGGFRPWFRYAEDAEFWTTVGAIGYRAQHVVQDGWFHYRLHNKSASQVHRTGEIREPDWTEFHPWTKDGQRPFAADGNAPLGSWPVRFYLKPDVSIVIPVGEGHEKTIGDALHSVEGQTHRNWECIVVNDTFEPLDLMGFPWAKVIRTTGGGGAGYARNIGAKHAHAPFIVFLDADDILKPRFLELALKTYRQTGRYVYSDWMTDDRRGHVEVHRMPEYSFEALRNNPSVHAVTALIPRLWFDRVGGFDESMPAYEDVDLFLKMRTHGYCGTRIPEPLLVYNLDAGFRRHKGQSYADDFKALLKQRYGDFMEGKVMCDCVEPPAGKKPVPPTAENAAEYRDAYGEMILVEYTGQFAPVSPTTLRGPATRVPYGARAKGDVFYVWEADLVNSEGTFTRVAQFDVEPVPTVVPPPPPETLNTMTVSEAVEFQTIDPEADTQPADVPDEKPTIESLLTGMTKKQLKAYADEHEIDVSKVKTWESMVATILSELRSRETS